MPFGSPGRCLAGALASALHGAVGAARRPTMRVELFSPQGSWKSRVDAAVLADSLGFDSIGSPEIAHDPFIPLALASQRTERISLRTAVAVAFARSPMIAANLSWDIHA